MTAERAEPPPIPWRRNVWVLTFSGFVTFVGIGFMYPLIPLYLQQIGITDAQDVRLWAGAIGTGQGISFALSAPLWDSDLNRARVAAARTRLDARELDLENERRVVVLDIRNAIARMREARSRLDVLKQSEEVARRSYEIDLARFENGNITAQELTQTRDGLTRAQQAYLEAYIQYQVAVADLKRQTLYDFEIGESLANRRIDE